LGHEPSVPCGSCWPVYSKDWPGLSRHYRKITIWQVCPFCRILFTFRKKRMELTKKLKKSGKIQAFGSLQ